MTVPILVLGNVNVDLVMGPVDGWPAIGTEIEVERAEMRAGGSAGKHRAGAHRARRAASAHRLDGR